MSVPAPFVSRIAASIPWVLACLGGLVIVMLAGTGVTPIFAGVAAFGLLLVGAVGLIVAPPVRRWIPVVAPLAVLVLSLSAQGADDGTDVFEILFGVSLTLFLAGWYGTVLMGGIRTLRTNVDVMIAFFVIVGGLGGIVLGMATNGWSSDLRSDVTCVMALAMFFPLRELCVRSNHGPRLLAGALIGIGLYAASINTFRLYGALTGARELYEVVDVRIASGEIQIVGALLVAALWLTASRSWKARLALFAISSFLLAGLILTKSRGAWLTAVIGFVVAGGLAEHMLRRRLVGALVGGAFATIAAGILAVGPQLALIGIGVIQRFTSLSTAATADVSLLNRYAESAAAWDAIVSNPILGAGWGAPVVRFDLTVAYTFRWSFLHNGYLWIWHKVGIWGLVLFLGMLIGTLWHGTQAARAKWMSLEHRALALGSVGALVAYAILALPSNPYAILDQMLIVSITLGLASGLWVRTRSAQALNSQAL